MSGHRINRISEDIKRHLSEILRTLKDPRISKLLSIVKVDVAGDLSIAKIYISAIEGYDETLSSVEALKSAQGFVRRELASRLKLRHTPELKFIADDSIIYGSNISRMIDEISRKEKVRENEDNLQ